MEKICGWVPNNSRNKFLAYLPQIFAWSPPVRVSTKKQTNSRGGVRQKFAEHMPKICSGCHSVPTHQIFSIDNVFFPQHFQDPPIFFRKCKFFPLKFGDPPTFLWKIHIYQIFDPLTSRPLSVLCSLFCDFCFFFMSFLSFWAIQACKIVKNGTFLMFFF